MVNAIPSNYQYGNYEFGRNNPFGRINGVEPRVTGTPSVDNSYGISIPENFGFVENEIGNPVSLGQDGYGLAHNDGAGHSLHLIG